MLALLKDTYNGWSKNRAPMMAAALAYYTLFAIAPLLIIVIEVGALVIGEGQSSGHHRAVENVILEALDSTVGRAASETIAKLVESTLEHKGQGAISSLVGWVVMLCGAAGLFGALQQILNAVWDVPTQQDQGLLRLVRDRFFSFAMILGVAMVLLASLCFNAVAIAFSGSLARYFPSHDLVKLASICIAYLSATLLFAIVYKYLPDIKVEWRDVWIGAAFTALLLALGQALLTLYFSTIGATSTFGAAGSLVVVLLWVYYSAQIWLFGAEFTRAYAVRYGSRADDEARSEPAPAAPGEATST
jgi:membrane protein